MHGRHSHHLARTSLKSPIEQKGSEMIDQTHQSTTMQAITMKRAGSADRLTLSEVPTPVPDPGDLLVRIHAATVTRGDVVMRKMPKLVARLFGERPRTIPGYEYAGVVESLGSRAEGYTVGDRVFGTTSGLRQGSYAEYIAVPANGMVVSIPEGVGFGEAAPVPVGAMAAFDFLCLGGAGERSRVLINGASGSVGTFAVQIAKHLGSHVTGVAGSSNVELVAALGADDVIDYTKDDPVNSGRIFDVIFDAVGKTSEKQMNHLLAEGGRFVTTKARRRETRKSLLAVRDLLASGAITPVVDRTYALAEVTEAHRHVEQGHKRGNILIRIDG
ncbi:MAG: NAD(P)-dependent alcohol dehydrogenase [Armatimonadetes bacterium]|nr:MAG: NAD(P)-dependent alcohol dehydrogenase [Armatimonadota bacterium]